MQVLFYCQYKTDRNKSNGEKMETSFPPLYVNDGFFFAMETALWSNLPENLMQPFPTPMMLLKNLIKIGRLALEIFKFKMCEISLFKGNLLQSE